MDDKLRIKLDRIKELVKVIEDAERELERILGWKGNNIETLEHKADRLKAVPITDYQCERCHDHFRSNLEIGMARCTKCGSKNVCKYVEPPVTIIKSDKTFEEAVSDLPSQKTGRRFKDKGCCGSTGPRHKKECPNSFESRTKSEQPTI